MDEPPVELSGIQIASPFVAPVICYEFVVVKQLIILLGLPC